MEGETQDAAGSAPAETPPAAAAGAPVEGAGEGAAEGKECAFCGSIIAAFADRCPHCAGFLPVVEGRAFKQHFFFLFACIAMFIGALLPWEGQWLDSYGFRSKSGAFLLAFSAYGIVASGLNVFHRQMIVWPVMLAALDGVLFGWMRVFGILGSDAAKALKWDSKDLPAMKESLLDYMNLFGPGLYLVVIVATIFWFVLLAGIIQGGRAVEARKAAEKAARAGTKRR